jgi:alkanesulfonate monooxygenase SsuD/methylene tetrahydromethanopterin reductase-like flavin-dependent oxidoreductase (luciferase family)
MGDSGAAALPPVEGSPAEIATALRAYADEGIAEVQLVVDPITAASIETLAEALAELDRG